MNYTNIKHFCTSNGPGVRTALFVAGCRLHCKGCFNKIAWDFNSGKELTDEKIDEILDTISPEYMSGLSLLGGEPLDENNVDGIIHILDKYDKRYGLHNPKKNVWLWSGYPIETLMKDDKKRKAIEMCDYIVEGPFEEDKWNSDLMYRGSSNQHIYKWTKQGFVDSTDSFHKVD